MKTPFSEAFDKFRQERPEMFRLETLSPGPYLENRLHSAFSAGWVAAFEQAGNLVSRELTAPTGDHNGTA